MKEFKRISMWELDFAVPCNCVNCVEDIYIQMPEIDFNNYQMRIGYLRHIWKTSNIGTYEYPELESYSCYEEFKKGGKGAMKCYIFTETKESINKRWKKVNEENKKFLDLLKEED